METRIITILGFFVLVFGGLVLFVGLISNDSKSLQLSPDDWKTYPESFQPFQPFQPFGMPQKLVSVEKIVPRAAMEPYRRFYEDLAHDEQVPPALVEALVDCEDATWNPEAQNYNRWNNTIDMGLGQINSTYWLAFATDAGESDGDPYNGFDNLAVVVHLLARLHAQYGDWTGAIVAYHGYDGQTEAKKVLARWVEIDP